MAGHTVMYTAGVPTFGVCSRGAPGLRPAIEPRHIYNRQIPLHQPPGHMAAASAANPATLAARAQMPVRIIASQGLSIGVLPLAGELSMHTVAKIRPHLKTFVDAQGLSGYIFDLSHVTRLDTAGIALLVELAQWCRQHQVVYACTRPSQMVRNLIELTNVSSILNVVGDTKTAVGLLQRPTQTMRACRQ